MTPKHLTFQQYLWHRKGGYLSGLGPMCLVFLLAQFVTKHQVGFYYGMATAFIFFTAILTFSNYVTWRNYYGPEGIFTKMRKS